MQIPHIWATFSARGRSVLHRIAFSVVSEWCQCDPRVDPRLRDSFAWPLGLLSVEGTLSSMLGQPLGLT